MASILKVDKLDPQSGTTLELGTSGDTVDIPSGVTLSGAGTITASAANLAASGAGGVTGTLPVGNAGTGLTSYAAGDVVYASGTTTLAKLAKPGTPADEVLTFATGASAPSWVAAGGGGKVLKVTTQSNTSNGTYVNSTSILSAGPDFALDITYTSGSLIQILMNGAFMSDAYGYASPGVSAASSIYLYKTTGTVPAENSGVGSDTAIGRLQYGNYDMHSLSIRNWGTHQNLAVNFFDSPTGTACKYYLASKSNAKLTCEIYATPTAPYMAMAVEYDTS